MNSTQHTLILSCKYSSDTTKKQVIGGPYLGVCHVFIPSITLLLINTLVPTSTNHLHIPTYLLYVATIIQSQSHQGNYPLVPHPWLLSFFIILSTHVVQNLSSFFLHM